MKDWMVNVPQGWRGLCESLVDELIRLDPHVEILDAKEKYGMLETSYNWFRMQDEYDCTTEEFEKIEDILDKYQELSKQTCIFCSKFNAPMRTDGWISPICDDCWNTAEEIYDKE